MRKIVQQSFLAVLLLGFALYTIPICTCVEMMKQSESQCCSAKAEAKPFDCCENPTAAEKMNPEKAFESAKVSLPSLELLLFVKFPSLTTSSQFIFFNDVRLAHSPSTQAFLQVFRI